MKNILLLLCVLFSLSCAYGQDIILLKNGTKIRAKVIEVGESEIKYKKFDNPDGPAYTLLKEKANKITFKNGAVEELMPNRENDPLFGLKISEIVALYKKLKKDIHDVESGYSLQPKRIEGVSFPGSYVQLRKNGSHSITLTNLLPLYEKLDLDDIANKPYNAEGKAYGLLGNLATSYPLSQNEQPGNEQLIDQDFEKLKQNITIAYGQPYRCNDQLYWDVDAEASVTTFVKVQRKRSGYYIAYEKILALQVVDSPAKVEAAARADEKAKQALIGSEFDPGKAYSFQFDIGISNIDSDINHLSFEKNHNSLHDLEAAIEVLKKKGIYHSVVNKGRINLTGKYPVNFEGIDFNDGGITFDTESTNILVGEAQYLILIKRIKDPGSLSKDELKERETAIKNDYKRLIAIAKEKGLIVKQDRFQTKDVDITNEGSKEQASVRARVLAKTNVGEKPDDNDVKNWRRWSFTISLIDGKNDVKKSLNPYIAKDFFNGEYHEAGATTTLILRVHL